MVVAFWSLSPLLFAAVPQSVFVLLYGIPALGGGAWWRDRVGRALFLKAVALGVVLDLLTAHVLSLGVIAVSFAAPVGFFGWAETIGYWSVLAAVIYQLVALLRQRRDR